MTLESKIENLGMQLQELSRKLRGMTAAAKALLVDIQKYKTDETQHKATAGRSHYTGSTGPKKAASASIAARH